MNKLPVTLITLGFILSACGPAAQPPTVAPTDSAPTAALAITAQESTVVFATAAPADTATSEATLAVAATSGGPLVITVLPANGTPAPAGTHLPAPAATPVPTLAAGLSPSELKFHVLAAYPNLFFCDPDFYPVARDNEADLAVQHFPELQANQEEFQAILKHNRLAGATAFSADQKLLIYRDHKQLAAIGFVLTGQQYQFQLRTSDSKGSGQLITGLIDGQGAISAQQSQPTIATCPICLAAQTQIDTPRGAVVVVDLRAGDLVWTVYAAGARVAAPIQQTVRVPVPAAHQMVHLTLDDGRQLWASPGHPTSDGRSLGNLAPGDRLDGARVTAAERVSYGQPATYDLLPAGPTGFYWANGILIGSTLK